LCAGTITAKLGERVAVSLGAESGGPLSDASVKTNKDKAGKTKVNASSAKKNEDMGYFQSSRVNGSVLQTMMGQVMGVCSNS
jgi:hypothetical protein